MNPADKNVIPINSPSSSSNGGGGSIETRLARIETKLEFAATREDIAELKVTILRWLIGFLATGTATLVIALIRTFSI